MRYHFKRAITLLLLLVLGCSPTSDDAISSFFVDGLQIVLKTSADSSGALGFYLRGGNYYIGRDRIGLESLLWHLSITGTETRTSVELARSMDGLGTDFNIVGGHDFNGIELEYGAADFERAWNLLADVILNPRLAPDALALAKEQAILDLKLAGSDRSQLASVPGHSFFFKGHPYAWNPAGNADQIAAFTRNDLIQYHRNDLTKTRAVLVIIGQLDIKDLTAKVRNLAARLPLGPELLLSALAFDHGAPDLKTTRTRGSENHVSIYFSAPKYGHPDYPAFVVGMEYLAERVYAELVEGYHLAEAVEVGFAKRQSNFGYIHLICDEAVPAINGALEILKTMSILDLSVQKLDRSIARSILRYRMTNQTPTEQLQNLVRWELVGESWEKSEQFVPELTVVQSGQIKRVFRRYCSDYHVAVVGPDRVRKSRLNFPR